MQYPFATGLRLTEYVCPSKHHCLDCRKLVQGREFRRQLQQVYDTGSSEVDFPCPFGVPWDVVELPGGVGTQLVPSYKQWPLWARAMRLLRTSSDAGLGDTIARVIGPIGGDVFKAWYLKVVGHECGCDDRQERLNELYRYSAEEK